jgi:(p)ppGpp synthase/HD superfamily hydrolase
LNYFYFARDKQKLKLINMWNPDIYLKAINYAADAHKDQKNPGSERSYMTHVTSVTMEVMTAYAAAGGFDVNFAVQCALLHDVIEDTPITYEEVVSHFGKEVADGVLALTKDESLEKSLQMKDSLQRILLQPNEVWIVKLADRVSNLQPPPSYWTAERKAFYKNEALEILETLKGAHSFIENRLAEKIRNY